MTPVQDHEPIEYLLSGIDQRGRRRYERVVASSVDQARSVMEQRGYSELELHSDDLRRSHGGGQPGGGVEPGARLSAKDEAALLSASPLRVRLLLAKTLYKSLALPVLALSAGAGLTLVSAWPTLRWSRSRR